VSFDRKAIRRDITERRFGRLVALWPSGKTRRGYVWALQCDDGNIIHRTVSLLLNGKVRSCGCLHSQVVRAAGEWTTTHGMSFSSEYKAYRAARNRCTLPSVKAFQNYGARGIKFMFANFEEFLAHIGPKPSPKLYLDRIDNEGHYEPGNVRWATRSQSNKNRRMPWKKAA
jgi:hypothetical protein